MGSFVFKWDHPASEVYVTGTFDNWSKSEKLIKTGDVFEKNVTLPSATEKIYYKFVVDGNWITDHTAPQENDYSGNLNNVLTVDRIVKHKPETAGIMSGVTPTSTTANLAKQAPLEKSLSGSSDLPGSFPETPGLLEKGDFGVNPLPAFNGAVNPISLAPGEKVPHPSTLTKNTLISNVRDDPELVAAAKKEGEQTFSVDPLPAFAGGVNPISLPAGQKIPNISHITGSPVNSGVTLDKESYENSGALGKAPVLPPVVTPQSEREHNGTGILGLPPISKNMIPESSLPMGTSGEGLYDASPMVQSSGPLSTTALLAGAVPLESSKVPAMVKESQREAGVDAEASAIPEEVNEKSAVEKELLKEVPVAPSTAEGTAGKGTDKSEKSVTASEVAAAVGGAALAVGGAAYAYASKGASNIASQLPSSETVQKSVTEGATTISNQLPSNETVRKSISEGASTVTSKLPTSIQDSIASMNQEAVQHSTAKDTPAVVKESIAESGQSPEAAANEEAVLEKMAVERELLSEIKRETSAGESAPKITSATTPASIAAPISEKKLTDSEPESPFVAPITEKKVESSVPVASAPIVAPVSEKKLTNSEPESPFVAPIAEKKVETSVPITPAPTVAPVTAPVAPVVAPVAEKKVEALATPAAPVADKPVETRDVSPGTVPGSHTQAAAVAPTTPAKKLSPPTNSIPSSSKADSPAASSTTDKKKKRTSFFGKLKEKLSSHKH